VFRLELPACPGQPLVVFFVLGVRNCLKKLLVARCAPDVLGRTCPFATNDSRIPRTGSWGIDGLEDDIMLPAVTEIVLVDEPIFRPLQYVLEKGASLADSRLVKFPVRRSVIDITLAELVKMPVPPSHRSLEHTMKFEE
jgi:hypothetical protein